MKSYANKKGMALFGFYFCCLAASLVFLTSYAFAEKPTVHYWAKGNIAYNTVTKTATIKGTVTDEEIMSSRYEGPNAWSREVEHIVFEEGTHLELVADGPFIDSEISLFGGSENDTEHFACPHLKTVVSTSVVVSDLTVGNTGKLLAGCFLNDTELQVCALDGWDLTSLTAETTFYAFLAPGIDLDEGDHPISTTYSLVNWKMPSDMEVLDYFFSYVNIVPTGSGNSYYCPSMRLDASLGALDSASMMLADDGIPSYLAYYGEEDSAPAKLSNATEWHAYFADASHQEKPTYIAPIDYPSEESTYYQKSVAFMDGENGLTQVTLGNPLSSLTLPEKPSVEGKVFLGWATSPSALEPSIIADRTDDLPLFAVSAPVYYAVYEDAPEPGPEPTPDPTPGTEDGWVQTDAGWQYVLNGEFLNDGWHYFEDEFGNHWYYFDSDTYMATSRWIWDDAWEGWYWVCSTGPMIENLWQWIDNAWYGFWWGGKMCTGWVWDTDWNAWFYCYQNGIMAKSTWIDAYWVDWRGIWLH